ncbi:diacylglycerol/lipid kinase family protein [Halogeometricum limi]|uniref:Lipid kinase, YegS/Rv2252/BmrU family n=1 Tax=Halogeometricum limi TaxID=555875 RepID=A0A1I6G2I2_9EURY|nr:diacylglycerol kinase family protein [Halogeometricum limi]SFR36372.1 lipid kinase, YegS/Rv2252/BmrU family [Halogeometricum limi]
MTTTADTDHSPTNNTWRIVLNPDSGSADHAERVRSLAAERGYTVRETRKAGDAATFVSEAVSEGVTRIAACGGDGTVHNVVDGLGRADALGEVTLGVLPGGTGNDFADNIGVESIDHAFELLESGETRRLDLGVADDELFTNSCIAGLTAQTSAETESEMKQRFGRLAYVVAGLQTVREFEPLRVEIDAEGASGTDAERWSGEALAILVGNARRFTGAGGQANVEDGLFEVTIVEEMPTSEMLTEAAVQRFFGGETDRVTHLRSDRLRVTSHEREQIEFSLDGEMREHHDLSMTVRPKALAVVVGERYDPSP